MAVYHVANGWDYADLIDRVLDKGIVLDGAGRVQLMGEELARSEDHVVVRSTDTYLGRAA